MANKGYELTGQRFGLLTVERRGSSKRRPGSTNRRWWCNCSCGGRKLVTSASLVSGTVKSCGCLRRGREASGPSCFAVRLWRIWNGMKSRSPVRDPKILAIYRGPGTHEPAWDSYEVFREWAFASGYKDDLTLDRIDNDLGYWPDNCRWITMQEQQRNKTNHVWLEVDGERVILAEAAERAGIHPSTIQKRIKRGWPAEVAVLKLPQQETRRLAKLHG